MIARRFDTRPEAAESLALSQRENPALPRIPSTETQPVAITGSLDGPEKHLLVKMGAGGRLQSFGLQG
jgi:hypothetical protein